MWPFRKIDTSTSDRPDPEAAQRDLERTRAETEQVRLFSLELRALRQRNHLAEAFLRAADTRRGK